MSNCQCEKCECGERKETDSYYAIYPSRINYAALEFNTEEEARETIKVMVFERV